MPARLPTPVTSFRWYSRLLLLLVAGGALFLPWADWTYDDGSAARRTAWELISAQLLDRMHYVGLGIGAGIALLFLGLRAKSPPTRRVLLGEAGFAGLLTAGLPPIDRGFWVTQHETTPAAGCFVFFGAVLLWQVLNILDVVRAPFSGEDETSDAERAVTVLLWAWALGSVVAVTVHAKDYWFV